MAGAKRYAAQAICACGLVLASAPVGAQSCSDLDRELGALASTMARLRVQSQSSAGRQDWPAYCSEQRQFLEVQARGILLMRARVGACGITAQQIAVSEQMYEAQALHLKNVCEAPRR